MTLALTLSDGRGAVLGLAPAATSIGIGADVSSWDLAGRPFVLVRGDSTWRRGLDGRLLEKRPAAGGEPRRRRLVGPAEGEPVIEAAREDAGLVLQSLRSGGAASDDAPARLRTILGMDAAALADDARRFGAACARVGILPPDQYLALVLRVTEGCSWNACTFCGFYRDVPFRVKTPQELLAHAAAVREYFGAGLSLRRSVFLGDANALCVAHDRLLPLVEAAARSFPGRGLHAFVDAWTGRRKTAAEYRAYAALGLRRVYVGLETGDPGLLSWLQKAGTPDDAGELVRTLHEAGVAVGVIVLLKVGGARFAETHVRATAETLTRMRLRGDDLLYFSDFVDDPQLDYGRRATEPDLRPLDEAGCARQRAAIRAAFRPADGARPPRTASYDVREFLY